jgi:L-lactate dehydrogenase (cytochrome)
MLGMPVSIPVYVSPAAMAKLGHPLGEVNITRAAGKAGIIQGVSSPTLLPLAMKGCG